MACENLSNIKFFWLLIGSLQDGWWLAFNMTIFTERKKSPSVMYNQTILTVQKNFVDI